MKEGDLLEYLAL